MESMNPKPSVVMSMVVKIAGCGEHEESDENVVTVMTTYLVVKSISDVPSLKGKDEPHRVCDAVYATAAGSLLARHTDVDENPENKSWTEFIERLDIE